MLLRNVNECGDATDEFLLGVGTLLRNVNECGDTTDEFFIGCGDAVEEF